MMAARIILIKGNGHSIYQCWDEAGFAFINEVDLTFDFMLTARFAELEDVGPGTAGLTLKSQPTLAAPVLDLRWDYYYPENANDPNGLRWFNRITPSEKIGTCDQCESGLCQGTDCHPTCTNKPEDENCWQGCLNLGYENSVAGYTEKNGLWVRVVRNDDRFYLFATYDTTKWDTIDAVSMMGTPILPPVGSMNRFRLPETVESRVYTGFTVVGVKYGNHFMEAKFDNISLAIGGDVPWIDTAFNPTSVVAGRRINTSVAKPRLPGTTLRAPDGMRIQTADLYNAHGKQIASLVREGDHFKVPASRTMSAGAYVIRAKSEGNSFAILYVIQ